MSGEWCGHCSWDGWIFTKDEKGAMFAQRCYCWTLRQSQGTLGDRPSNGQRFSQEPEKVGR